MKQAYFDASAIIKLGHVETESQSLIDYIAGEQLWAATSVVADVEVRQSLRRLQDRGADTQEHVRGFFLVELTRDIRNAATELGATLRTLDAIHLATALSIDRDLDFITYDDRLASAARAEGLRVVTPGR
ncbi:MAG TPA: type II toxin-antitoxin system VapC family toxin [Vicinamibacterales bacterium]|nr:type II toxin-antitoxin system VapC family toxin [Vicinamibacterales bacterium]